jgi:hypothetical protein
MPYVAWLSSTGPVGKASLCAVKGRAGKFFRLSDTSGVAVVGPLARVSIVQQ